MDSKDYTKDGSVDLRGRPVLASTTGKWKACSFLVGYEAFERMAFYGVASNLVVYLTTQLHEDTVSSVRNVNNWSGSVWMTPILGAYIADTYMGRFWTFTISSLIYVMGMVLLTLAVSLKSFKPTCSNGICNKATTSQIAFFYSSLYIIAIGAGGTKPNISTFGADQFDDFNPQEKELKVSFFNWWMFSSFLGALIATLGLVYIQENVGWGLGYGIPTLGLLLSLVIFYYGSPSYRHKPRKSKSPAKNIVRVPIVAFSNRNLELPSSPLELHEVEPQHYMITGKRRILHTPAFRFLDKAAIKDANMEGTSSLHPCTVTQVEETKLVLGMFLIWKTGNPRGITLLQRLGIGCALQIISIVFAYAVEMRRMYVIREHGTVGAKDTVPMTIFWLMPQYVVMGIADVFNAIGFLEFFYDQSPGDMQSLGTTFFTSGIGVGNFLNSFLVTMVDKITGRGGRKSWIGNNLNDSHLDYYYGFLLGIAALNLGVFLWVSSKYTYKKETILDEGKGSCIQMEGKAIDNTPLALQV
ncbi:hypothetical protein AQUCO_00500171v1 [Aquilegia coerulea]|uniref:Major facilitator superfamily (MFS) profile domain-containing protein n=1 Tax=Aquilegia coerulea TaxID=218851 RepID=A0A2G5EQM9_AQUCA|nr:hypothetical protein AQUCO_00500171v1 [Aquilegia coerulea]